MVDHEKLEKNGLVLSIVGALSMAALGFGFAVLTSSDAVLLDGFFSLIGFAVGLVSLRVATLVRRPDDEFYHFGYAAYEPMLNLTKGLLMAFVTLFALVSAILVVIEGGREIEAGWASVYAFCHRHLSTSARKKDFIPSPCGRFEELADRRLDVGCGRHSISGRRIPGRIAVRPFPALRRSGSGDHPRHPEPADTLHHHPRQLAADAGEGAG
jgi:hypothetical protein